MTVNDLRIRGMQNQVCPLSRSIKNKKKKNHNNNVTRYSQNVSRRISLDNTIARPR